MSHSNRRSRNRPHPAGRGPQGTPSVSAGGASRPDPSLHQIHPLLLPQLIVQQLGAEVDLEYRPALAAVHPVLRGFVHERVQPWAAVCERCWATIKNCRDQSDDLTRTIGGLVKAIDGLDLSGKDRFLREKQAVLAQHAHAVESAWARCAAWILAVLVFAAVDAAMTAFAIRDDQLFGPGLLGLGLTWLVASLVAAVVSIAFHIGYFEEYVPDEQVSP